MAAVAQASTLGATESLELMRCLLRVSVFHVAHMRGLFPDSAFKAVDMKNLDNLRVMMLQPGDNSAGRLIQWVDGGAQEALAKGYLATMAFGIAADAACTRLVEEFVYKFSYAEDGTVAAVDFAGPRTRKKGCGALVPAGDASFGSVKTQIVALMRTIIQRHVFMRLTYRDHTPDDYEPAGFRACAAEGAYFEAQPFVITAGRVQTRDHAVSLAVKSVLDPARRGPGGSQPVAEADATSEGGVSLSTLLTEAGGKGRDKAVTGDLVAIAEVNDGDEEAASQPPLGTPARTLPASIAAAATRVRDFVTARAAAASGSGAPPAAIEYVDLMARFDDMGLATLEKRALLSVDALVVDGVLRPLARGNTYAVAAGAGAGGTSNAAGIQAAGSEGTQSPGGGRPAQPRSPVAYRVHPDASQLSRPGGGGAGKRKASMVAIPIPPKAARPEAASGGGGACARAAEAVAGPGAGAGRAPRARPGSRLSKLRP